MASKTRKTTPSPSKKIKSILAYKDIKYDDVAEYFNMTKQSLSNKLSRGTFTLDDMIKFGNVAGAKLVYQFEDGYHVDFTVDDLKNKEEVMEKNMLYVTDKETNEIIDIIGEENWDKLKKYPADLGNMFDFISADELEKYMDFNNDYFPGGLLTIQWDSEDEYWKIIDSEYELPW